MTVEDEGLLMAVLNSAPVENGRIVDQLDGRGGAVFVRRFGGVGSTAERRRLVEIRDLLHDIVRKDRGAYARLTHILVNVDWTPSVGEGGITWTMRGPDDDVLSYRVALAWSRVAETLPGRLRPCANDSCNLFLVDHSKPGTAKWCSMAACGNRHKARVHAERQRGGGATRSK